MGRSRASAKAAGARFESSIAAWLAEHVSDYIERRRLGGAQDRGDLAGVRTLRGERVAVEIKDYGGRVLVGPWLKEARVEAGNDDAPVAVVIAKRRGTTKPEEQIVLMELRDLAILLGADLPMETP